MALAAGIVPALVAVLLVGVPAVAGAQETAGLWEQIQSDIRDGKTEDAIAKLEQYRKGEPADDEALREQARLLSWVERYDESLALYTEYLEERKYDLDVAVEKAQVMAWAGDMVGAEALVREVLEREPEHLEANLLLAAIFQWTGRTREAEDKYQYVLKLDPENEMARTGNAQILRLTATSIEGKLSYTQDTSDFLMFGLDLGVRFYPTRDLGLMPFLQGVRLTGPGQPVLWGEGGGLLAEYDATEALKLLGSVDLLYYGSGPGYTDVGGLLGLKWKANGWLTLGLEGDTHLYGELGQSAGALTAGVRYYRLTGSGYVERGRWTVLASAAEMLLALDGLENRVTTLSLSPMYRLLGGELRLKLGTRHWYTGYADHATDALYWSPLHHHSHLGVLRFEGGFDSVDFYIEGGAGVGFEKSRAVAGTEGSWDAFFAASPAAGLTVRWTPDFETDVSGWSALSSRDGEFYAVWNAMLNVLYRW